MVNPPVGLAVLVRNTKYPITIESNKFKMVAFTCSILFLNKKILTKLIQALNAKAISKPVELLPVISSAFGFYA